MKMGKNDMFSSITKRPTRWSLAPWTAIVLNLAAHCMPATAGESPTARCAKLLQAAIPDTRIELAHTLPSRASFTNVDGSITTTQVSLCRVVAIVSTEPKQKLGIEVWMPLDWNGRLLGAGKSGFGGFIDYRALTTGTGRGFATVSGDTGYKGSGSGEPGKRLDWAADPTSLSNWAHLSVHSMTVAAKAIMNAYYGRGPEYSYFSGCGGVEAMQEVQNFSSDYDGVDARSPGIYYGQLMESFLSGAMLPARQPDARLTKNALALLNRAALRSCGGTPGLENGFLDDPSQCHFDPAQLQCKGGDDGSGCLSAKQVEEAKRLYSPVRNSVTGEVIYPGFAPGSESGWEAIQSHLAVYYAQPLLASAVFGNPEWDWTTFDFGADASRVDKGLSSIVNATNPDISAFTARGGKLIITQGWADATNAPTRPIDYFNAVAAREGGVAKAQQSLLLVMVPGMGHCGFGPGPTTLGGSSPPTQYSPDRDVISALQAWVEHGKRPTHFVATKYADDRPEAGVRFERPACVYPASLHYNGAGDRRLASSFECVPPAEQVRTSTNLSPVPGG